LTSQNFKRKEHHNEIQRGKLTVQQLFAARRGCVTVIAHRCYRARKLTGQFSVWWFKELSPPTDTPAVTDCSHLLPLTAVCRGRSKRQQVAAINRSLLMHSGVSVGGDRFTGHQHWQEDDMQGQAELSL